MCGIVGIRRFAGRGTPWDTALVDRMTDTLAHRGPNDRGIWCDDRVALGHRRLSVIDLSPAGHQPMGNETGRLQLTFNGEIYNFKELKDRFCLEAQGHVFRSRTDSEVLIHLFEDLGPRMAPHLNGMFAFGLWDAATGALHLARDPYGVKPLFYHYDRDEFRFASELKALLAHPRVPRRLSLQALHDYLSFNYVPGAQTAFADIHEVPPGTWLTLHDDGQIETHRFWSPSYRERPDRGLPATIAEADRLMDQAVHRQLVADVPVGVMLSGGLDSSALVAYMSGHATDRIRTYSVGFEDASFNELPYARHVAQHFGTEQREVVVTADHVRRLLPEYLRFIDEPYGDGSAIPTYYVCQMAKDEVVVVLSGEGGDEAFAGYDTHAALKAHAWARRVPSWIRHGLLAPIIFRLPVSHRKLSLEFRLKRFLSGLDLPPAEAHLWWRLVLTEAQKAELYTDEVRSRFGQEPSVRHFTEAYARGQGDPLKRILQIDSTIFLPDDLMIKNDRMSMAHSLEARVPFTDPDLTEFTSTIPSRDLLPRLTKKHVMREALRHRLPERILRKKKVGLEMPYSRWFRRELRDVLETYLAPERLAGTGVFRPEPVRRLVDQHLAGTVDHGRPLWGLLNYMMWIEAYGVTL